MTLPLPAIQEALREAGLDGWLLYEFHGANPVARTLLGLGGMATRRLFVLLPALGEPVVVAHKIEIQPWRDFPGRVRPYAAWRELESALRDLVAGRRLALEISADDRVPYLDRVPWGVVQLLERLGATLTGSDDLVTRFAARWSAADMEDHRAAAAALAGIARATFQGVSAALAAGREVREAGVQASVLEAIRRAGLETPDPPIVAFAANAALPHYEPHPGADAALRAGQVMLLDLWGRPGPNRVFADQTWMAHAGAPPDDVVRVWEAVRDARDAVVAHLARTAPAGQPITGAALDDVARGHLTAAGYGEAFVHRTGHSIDREIHGSGPHLDNFETRDERRVLPDTGFSVEPGVYLEGRFGVRSEINVIHHANGPETTPGEPQRDLVVL